MTDAIGRESLRVVPNIARQIADQLKLAVLRLDGEWIAGVEAGKAALRTDREPVHRHKFDRLVDAPFKNSLSSSSGTFVETSPSTTDLCFGTKRSGVKLPARGVSYSSK